MKRYVFIIGLWAACFALPNSLQAQWGFTPTLMVRGECSAYMRNQLFPHVSGFATRAECEAVKALFLDFKVSNTVCSAYYVCGPCVGHDIVTAGSGDISGSVNTNGTAQGTPFYAANPFDVAQDAYEQKQFQNEVLLGDDESNRTITRNIPFDNAHAAITFVNGKSVSNGGKPFDKRLSRPGALGGFNIRPNISSVRYSGRQQFFSRESLMGSVNINNGKGSGEIINQGAGGAKVKDADLSMIGMQMEITKNTTTIKEGRHIVVKEVEYFKKIATDAQKAGDKGRAAEATADGEKLQTLLDNHENAETNVQENKDKEGKPCTTQACQSENNQRLLATGTALVKAINEIKEKRKQQQQQQQQQ
jgi:hypothetical protein